MKIGNLTIEFTKNKIIALSGAVVAIIGLFLTFLKATVSYLGYSASATVKFIEGRDGKLLLVALIAAAVLLVIKKFDKVCYSLTGLCFLATIYDGLINVETDEIKALKSYGVDAGISRGIGFYLVLAGLIAFAVGAFLEFKDSEGAATPMFGGNSQQPTYGLPQQPAQPTYSAPVQPQQPTYSAPQQPAQPSQDNTNNNF